MSEHTMGPWKRVALGGSSTVVAEARPERNDTRIPAYGYDAKKGYCIGYPFISDDNSIRLDFVCFSHADANLIAAAPDLLEALREGRRAIGAHLVPDHCYATGPATGDAIRDLVQCPACSFIAMYDAVIAKVQS